MLTFKLFWGAVAASSFFDIQPEPEQIEQLREDCLVQSTLKIWYELGGQSRVNYDQSRHQPTQAIEIEGEEEGKRKRYWIGMEIEKKWKDIGDLTGAEIFIQETT